MLEQREYQPEHQAESITPGEPCSLVASFSEITGIITVTGHGEWSETMVRRHFATLEKMIAEIRASGRPVLALVDLRKAENQTETVAALAAREANRVHGKDDRIAIMASSSLMKMRMKEAASKSQREFFLSENAALTWLTAHHRH